MTDAAREQFDEFLDEVLEPDDYPGDPEYDGVTEFVADGETLTGDEARERWRIRDENGAAFAVRRARASQAEIARVKALADEQIAQIHEYVRRATAGPSRAIEFFESKLREFYEREFLPDPNRRGFTKHVPGARLGSRAGSVQTVIEEPDLVVEFLKEHDLGAFVETKETPKAGEMKKAFAAAVADRAGSYPAVVDVPDPETGEIETVEIPGVAFVRGERSFGIDYESEGS